MNSLLKPQSQSAVNFNAFATNPTANAAFQLTGWQQGLIPASPTQFANTLKKLAIINNSNTVFTVSGFSYNSGLATIVLPGQPGSVYNFAPRDTFVLTGSSISAYNNGWQINTVSGTPAGPMALTFYTSGISVTGAPPTGSIAIQQTAQLNLCAFGDSVAPKKPNYLFPQITANIPKNAVQSSTTAVGGSYSSLSSAFDINGAGGGVAISGGNGWISFGNGGNNPICDTVTVIYATESGAGTFKLQYSTDAGGPSTWNDISGYTSINANNTGLAAGVIVLKTPYQFYGVRAFHISGGAVRIAGIYSQALSQNGWNRYDIAQGGIAQQQSNSQSGDFRSAQLSAINPTLMSSEWKDSYTTVPIYLPPLVNSYNSITNNKIDWIFNATTPVSADAAYDSNPTTSPTYLENLQTQSVANSGNWYYFPDGWWMWKTFASLTGIGLQGDGTHVNTLADQMMANVEAQKLWFLVSQFGNVGLGNVFASNLSVGNTVNSPNVNISGNSSNGNVTITRNGGNFTYFNDAYGNNIATLSSHPTQYANPSTLPANVYFVTSGVTGAFWQTDGPSKTTLLRTTVGNGTTNYYSDVDAPFRSLNTPAYFQQGGVYGLICGVGAIAANSSGNFTLPTSPKQNGIYAVSALNVGWTLHQNASQLIRCGSHITTVGTGGYVVGGSADSITLLYAGTAGGNQEFRVIATSDAGNLTWV